MIYVILRFSAIITLFCSSNHAVSQKIGKDTNADRQIPIAHLPTAHLPTGTFTDWAFTDRGHLPTGTFTDRVQISIFLHKLS